MVAIDNSFCLEAYRKQRHEKSQHIEEDEEDYLFLFFFSKFSVLSCNVLLFFCVSKKKIERLRFVCIGRNFFMRFLYYKIFTEIFDTKKGFKMIGLFRHTLWPPFDENT